MNRIVIIGGGLTFVVALLWGFGALLNLDSRGVESNSNLKERSIPVRSKSSESANLAPGISLITDPGVHWEERIAAVRELPSRLGDHSVKRLFAFLSDPPAIGEENWYLVCNEIMEVLRKRDLASEVYTDSLLALVGSPSANPMIRDYAAQHLAQWIAGFDPPACEKDEALIASAFSAMVAEAGKTENGVSTLSGTTVHALTDAVINGSPAMRERRGEVSQLALFMIQQTSFSPINRSSAIQAAARLRLEGLSEICRDMAADPQVASDLRLSAIAALGLVGSEADISFIQSFTDDEAYKFAAAAALERLIAQNP